MTRSQKNSTSSFPYANDVACSRCAQDTILADYELLHSVSCPDLRDQLSDFWIPVSSIASDDERAVFDSLGYGKQDAGDE